MYIGLLLLIGVVVYFLVINRNNSSYKFTNRRSPEEILKERFVNGEIDEETYLKMKEVLKG